MHYARDSHNQTASHKAIANPANLVNLRGSTESAPVSINRKKRLASNPKVDHTALPLTHHMVRFKNRWLLVELIPCPTGNLDSLPQASVNISSKDIWSALKQSIIINFGDTGWGAVASSLTIKYYSSTTNMCIIRVARDQHRIAWAGITLLTSVNGSRCLPFVVHVSGTIKHAQMEAIRYNREIIARYRAAAQTPATYQDSFGEFLRTSTEEIEALQD